MAPPKAISIVGYKDAGKTRVVEGIVRELVERGYKVGTLKHSAEDDFLDKSGTDTWRHAEAGAQSTAILSASRTAIFYKRAFTIQKAIDALGELDFVIIEGFKSLNLTPKIIVPRTISEIAGLQDGLEIAIVDTNDKVKDYNDIPVYRLSNINLITDLVEKRAYPLLAGLNCKTCGYPTCRDLGLAILKREASYGKCIKYPSKTSLVINGSIIPMNEFVEATFKNVIKGLVKSLKGVDEPKVIEIKIEDD